MEKRQADIGAFWAVRWNGVLLGVLAYIALGVVVKNIPNPMVPDASLALNMIVPVLIGYFAGPVAGALTGLLGTTLNFSLQMPLMGSDAFEVAAIIPHTIMGAAAGWISRKSSSRMAAAMSIVAGHLLNVTAFLLIGLVPLALVWDAVFWTGLLAEASLGVIFITVLVALIQQFQKRELTTAVSRMDWRKFLLISGAIALLVVALALNFLSGVSLAGYLFVIPVILAAFALGSLEALLTAFVLSFLLGTAVVNPGNVGVGSAEALSLILILNLMALALGELAGNMHKQRKLADRRLVELENAYAALIEADRLKSEMIQNISHELRTPLAIILGYTELLVQGALGEMEEPQREILETTWEQGRRLAYLVEQITVMHQAEQGNLSWQALALDSLTRSYVDQIRSVAAENGSEILFSANGEIPVLEGDLQCLGRATHALLDNAIKFSPAGGQIEVKVWPETDRICFSVRDYGVGIPLEKQSEIFRRFYQVDGSLTRRFAGMGTGLALVKEVVQAHGGDVWVNSRPDQGSTFGFWLPLERPSGSHNEAPRHPFLTSLNPT